MCYISIVVPVYNAEKYIEMCIEALLSQSYPQEKYEIIMVDNNSTDRSFEIMKRYHNIQLLSENKQGSYAARNCGIHKAIGSIIAFTDADCIPDRNWLESIFTAAEADETKLVIGSRTPANDSFMVTMLAAYENEKDSHVFNGGIASQHYGHTNNMAVKRELFERLGTFMERDRGADSIFVRKAVDTYSCDVVRYDPRVRVRHLEIDRIRTYYRKVFTYGFSRRMYRDQTNIKPLSISQRNKVYLSTICSSRSSLTRSAALYLVLIAGMLCWFSGRFCAEAKLRFMTE